MAQVRIELVGDPSKLIPTIDLLVKMGSISQEVADDWKKASQSISADLDKTKGTVEKLGAAIEAVPDQIVDQKAKETIVETGKQTEVLATKTQKLTTQLRAMKQELSQLEQAGKSNTRQYKDLAVKAGQLEDQIGDTSARVRILASDTRKLDAALSLATGVAGGFAVAQGAAALFGSENEDLQKALLKVQAALAVVNGLQAVAATLNKDSAASVVLLGGAQRLYTTYIGASTGAVKLFKIALAGIGIGLAIFAIVEGVKALSSWISKMNESTKVMDGATLSYETFTEIQKKTTEGYVDEKVKLDQLLAVARDKNIALDKRKKAVEAINELSPKYLGDITLATIEQGKETTAVNLYIESLVRKSKARALEEILTQKQKELYEAENSALEDNLSFKDKLILLANPIKNIANLFGDTALKTDATALADKRKTESTKGLSDEIDELTKALTTVNKEILMSGDDLDIFGEKTTSGIKKVAAAVRTIQTTDPISILPSPDEFEANVVEPSIKIATDFYQTLSDLQTAEKEKNLEDIQEIKEARSQAYDHAVQVASQAFSAISNLSKTALDNELINLQEQLDKKQISQEVYDKKVSEAKHKAAVQEKILQVFRAALAVPQAILQALATPGGGIPLSIIAGAIAAADLIAIASAKIPAFAEGTRKVTGGQPGKDSVHALLMPGEGVITADVNREYDPILTAIHNKAIPSDFLNAFADMPNFEMISHMLGSGMAIPVFGGIDYDLLADKLGDKIAQLPISQTIFDENGFHRSLKNGSNRTDYLNKRYEN